MTTEITSTSINVNMDFDINLYQAAIKSNKHANFNISPRWRFGWCQYDFLPFVPFVKLLQSSTFAEKNELLRRKVADLVGHPIVLRTSRNRICCLTFLTWFWAYHFSKLHKAARKPNLRHRYRFLNLHWARYRPRLCTLEGSCAQLSCVQSCRMCSNFRSKEFLRR